MSGRKIADKAKPSARKAKAKKSIVMRGEDSPASASGKKMPGFNMFSMGKNKRGK